MAPLEAAIRAENVLDESSWSALRIRAVLIACSKASAFATPMDFIICRARDCSTWSGWYTPRGPSKPQAPAKAKSICRDKRSVDPMRSSCSKVPPPRTVATIEKNRIMRGLFRPCCSTPSKARATSTFTVSTGHVCGPSVCNPLHNSSAVFSNRPGCLTRSVAKNPR